MLRPLLAFACLALTAFLLAPTVQSVHQQVEDLDFKRDLPRLWKWDKKESAPQLLPLICDFKDAPTYSEVDKWPNRIRKNESFSLGGFVKIGHDATGPGLGGVTVDLFLNETKELPGEHLGTVVTGSDGRFTLTTTIPFELAATKYHLVAHAHQKTEGCHTYMEHWSDPEMEVTSTTRILLYPVTDAVAGHPFNVRGRVVDQVEAPVRNAEVLLGIGAVQRRVHTDNAGEFVVEHMVRSPGRIPYAASFAGTEYYGASTAKGEIEVARERLRIDATSVEIVRGTPTTLTGTVFLPPGTKPESITFSFSGAKLRGCAECPVSDRVTVTPDAEGRFRVTLLADKDQKPGAFEVQVTGGGLTKPQTLPGRIVIAVTLTLSAEARSATFEGLDGVVGLVDEQGRPWHGVVAAESAGLWASGPVDAKGNWTFGLDAPCGTQRVRALYNGSDEAMPAVAEQDVDVCPFLASIPPWLLAIPWWLWLLVPLVLLGAWMAYRRWRIVVVPVISKGPPLTLSHTGPKDVAAGIVGVGEAATLTAFLEEPLPKGHTLRMGLARRTEPVLVGPDLRAEWTLVPDALGEASVRAEVLDPRGRVVTRRTATVRVVRYAAEIETRYKGLRGATGARASVSPREFEAWLRERAPDMDPAVAARLVSVFEEADYGPRDAGRAELVAYMEAEAALPEVMPRAALA